MRPRFWQILVLVLFMANFLGCNLWKTTKKVYKGYVFSTNIDFENETELGNGQMRMARFFNPLDQELASLFRQIEVKDSQPTRDWARKIKEDFEWIEGVNLVDKQGQIKALIGQPSLPDKETKQLLSQKYSWSQNVMQWLAWTEGSRSMMTFIRPFYKDMTWQGNILVCFNIRSLVQLSEKPQEIIIIQQGQTLWTGSYDQEAQGLANLDWQAMLDKGVSGRVLLEGEEFFWLARYLGEKPIFYLVEVKR